MKRYLLTKRQGWAATIVAVLLYSTIGVLGKLAFRAGLSPLQTLKERFLFGSILLLPVFLSYARTHARTWKRDFLPAALFAGLPFTLATLFYFRALSLLSVPTTMFIFFNYPILAAILAGLLFKEHLGGRFLLSATLAAGGLAVLLSGSRGGAVNPAGVAITCAGALAFAFYTVASQRLSITFDPTGIGIACTFVPAVIYCCATLREPLLYPLVFHRPSLFLILLLLSICSTLGTLLLVYGITSVGARRVSAVDALEPFIGALLAVLFLREPLTPATIAGGILVLSALWVGNGDPSTPLFHRAGKRGSTTAPH